jgi:A nuclease family of the HNH/ENDO VII superfamily with conserved AHH
VLASTFMMTNGRYHSKAIASLGLPRNGHQMHHIIVKNLGDDIRFSGHFSTAKFDVNLDNLVELPQPFHHKHRSYTDHVAERLDDIITANGGSISLGDIKLLQDELLIKINKAYDNYLNTGLNMNGYFENGLHNLP